MTDNLNSAKQDRDPAQWLPSRARCTYAITWVQVKYRWWLKINAAEKTKLASVLSGKCGKRTVTIPKRAITATQASPSASTTSPGVSPANENDCSSTHPIKGNHSSSGDWIYHVPGGNYYDVTNPEECFKTTADAEAAGYRPSKAG